jgi:general secretion pathway protein K
MKRRVQRGAALLLAMIIVALVATITAGMVWQQNRAVQVEAAERARTQAVWVLHGALDWARLILREDQRANQQRTQPYDSLDEPWATPLEEARLSTFLAADKDNNADGGPEAFISGAIADAQARFNLRGLVDAAGKPDPVQVAALQRLCDLVGAPGDTAKTLAKALGDTLAAKATAGAPGTPGAADAPLAAQRLADLVWADVAPATLALLEPVAVLLPVATPVNLNTASREVLVAAIDGIDPGTAERLVQARQRKAFVTLDEAKALLSPTTALDPLRTSVTTSYFEVAGRLRLEERVVEERSLLVRRNNRVDVLRRERRSFSAP